MPSIHINVILVGADQFTTEDRREVNEALQRTRAIYATVGLSVTESPFEISVAAARGREFIDDHAEAEALTDEWTVKNQGLDVFFVRGYAGTTIGRSRVDGPCDKDAKGMDGSVVAIEGTPVETGIVTAHEAAHYLGLSHVNDVTNLMNPSLALTAFNLNGAQGANMRDHCFVVI